jgi:hypothetical protein
VPVTCPYPEPDQSSPYPRHTFWCSFLILSPIYACYFQVVIFPQVSSPRLSIHLYSPHTCYMPHPPHSSRFDHPNYVWLRIQIIELLILYFLLFPYYLVPLRPKYLPQHPIAKHHQPVFVPVCQRPRFTPIQINGQNYTSVYLKLVTTICLQIIQFIIKSNFCRTTSIPLFLIMQAFRLFLIQSTWDAGAVLPSRLTFDTHPPSTRLSYQAAW